MTELSTDIAILLGRFGSGGVERVACLLANGFADRGIAARLVVARRAGPAQDLVAAGVPVTELLGQRDGLRALGLLRAVPALVRWLNRHKPAILLSPGNHTHVAAALAHRLSGGKSRLVVKITNPVLKARHGPIQKALRKWLYKRIFARCDRILVLSRYGRDRVAEICPAATNKVVFVHNPYVRDALLACTTTDNRGTPMVLAVGRLSKQKNYPMLLRAMARLRERPWTLVFLGEGPERKKLELETARLGIGDRVRFEGFVSDPAPYYGSASALVLSSNWEDLPAVVLEALASGCPVVATDCSEALVEIVAQADGSAIVPVGDEFAFSEAVGRVLSSGERKPFPAAAAYSIEAGVADHVAALGLNAF